MPGLDDAVGFVAGESIHTENSTRYDDAHLARLVEAAGFAVEHRYVDDAEAFGLSLCRR